MKCHDIKILLLRSVTWTLFVLAGCLLKYSEWDLRKVFCSQAGWGGGGEQPGTGLLLLSLFSLLTSLSPSPLLLSRFENPGQDLFFILSMIIWLYDSRYISQAVLRLAHRRSLVNDNDLAWWRTALLCRLHWVEGGTRLRLWGPQVREGGKHFSLIEL